MFFFTFSRFSVLFVSTAIVSSFSEETTASVDVTSAYSVLFSVLLHDVSDSTVNIENIAAIIDFFKFFLLFISLCRQIQGNPHRIPLYNLFFPASYRQEED